MHDIRLIRDDAAAFDAGLALRGQEAQSARLLELDEKRREALTRQQEAETERT